MAIILNIETATRNCSVSIVKNGIFQILVEENSKFYSHSENIHKFIDYVFKKSAISIYELNAVSVSKGPGSYTGLRTGVSAAKGLCYGLNIPLIAIDTLTIMVHGFNANQGILIPMIDSQRNEVYTAIFNKKKMTTIEAKILDEDSFIEYTKNKIYIFGDGAQKARKLLKISAYYRPEFFPSAKYMSSLSEDRFQQHKFENIESFEPFYLKDFLVKPIKVE
ncbi:tRNA (adenosine(37)-N6)-threonylcarbamoyltransferase complex dimerization subunit type 1 TsaB [Candidatus Walczuchella monophlebidarum]|uniref:Peptidase M22 n=1 Tax=Candidatus Walczuchella monophlebidarum TaxID=1415657 RepID=A0A068DNI2_9FLAO|nr:tRNA (adenosine(37)-N6)-threonylcarbamoyltransferase complex dimerization subunit type 1 TsaB [Candidatus Walczuchella monophlebidarum]AID37315.1 Peptidase M22 [Candidatus Walczuchella monophlebidarum]